MDYQGKESREWFFLIGHHYINIMWASASTATSVIIHRLELLGSKDHLIFYIELNSLNVVLEENTVCIRGHKEVKNLLLPLVILSHS